MAAGAQINVRRFDIEVQQAVRVQHRQALEQFREHGADEFFRQPPVALDVRAQVLAGLVVHHHVDGVVFAEEVGDAHDVGVLDLGERGGLFEETLDAVAEGGGRFAGERRHRHAVAARGLVRGQVFLDDHALVSARVDGEIDDAEAADAQNLGEAVVMQQVAFRQGDLGLHGAARRARLRFGGKTCIMG